MKIHGSNGIKGMSSATPANHSDRMVNTSQKVNRIEMPRVKEPKQVRLLKDAKELYKNINRDWNHLEIEDLAAKIIDLQDKVGLLQGESSQVKRVKKAAEDCAFLFVFSVGKELEVGKEPTFASNITEMANHILKTQSLKPFNDLNAVQQKEIIDLARRGA